MSGWLDRAWKVATGVGGAIQAPVGLVADLASAFEIDKPEYDGFWHTLSSRTTERGAQLLGNLFGPHEGLGAAVGGLPETGVRDPARPVVHGVMDGLTTAYREGVAEPISTMMTVGSLADSPTYGKSWSAFVDPDSWKLAYKTAQHRSPGQAIALAVGTHDILDQKEVAKFQQTDAYHIASGLSDALIGWELDPGKLGGEGFKIAKARYIGEFDQGEAAVRSAFKTLSPEDRKAIRAGEMDMPEFVTKAGQQAHAAAVDTYLTSNRWEKVNNRIQGWADEATPRKSAVTKTVGEMTDKEIEQALPNELAASFGDHQKVRQELADAQRVIPGEPTGKADIDVVAGKVRTRYFPGTTHGDTISAFLAQAGDKIDRTEAMRTMLGDFSSINRLSDESSVLASHLSDYVDEMAYIKSDLADNTYHRSTVYRKTQKITDLQGKIDDVYDRLNLTDRVESAAGSVHVPPRETVSGQLRQATRYSDFYQNSPLMKPVRTFTNMTAYHMLDTSVASSDEGFDRLLRDAGFDPVTRDRFRGEYMRQNPTERFQTIINAEEAGFRLKGDQYGLSREQMDSILNDVAERRRKTTNVLQDSRYDAKGRTRIRFTDEDTGQMVDYPIMTSQLSTTVPVVDFYALDKAMKPLSRLNRKFGTAAVTETLGQAADSVMHVWKPAQLLRPAWPIRVIGDEQMRILAKIDALSRGSSELKKGMKEYASFRTAMRNYASEWANDASLAWGGGTGAIFGGLVAGPIGATVGLAAGVGTQRWLRTMDEIPFQNLVINGLKVRGAFGNGDDEAAIFQKQNSANDSFDEFVGKNERGILDGMKQNRKSWKTYSGLDGPHYDRAWEDAINNQVAQDPMAKIILSYDNPPPGVEPPPPPGWTPPKGPKGGKPRTPFVAELPSARTVEEARAATEKQLYNGKYWTGNGHQTLESEYYQQQLSTLAKNNVEHAEAVAHVPPDAVVVPDVELAQGSVTRKLKNPYSQGVPLMIKAGDAYYVADGVDKFVAAYQRGMPIQAHVVDLAQIDGMGLAEVNRAQEELTKSISESVNLSRGPRDIGRMPSPPVNPYPARTTVAAAPPPGWTTDPRDIETFSGPLENEISQYTDATGLYHATPALKEVTEQGLRNGDELEKSSLAGSGSYVSLTYSADHAHAIADHLQETIRAAKGEHSISDVVQWWNAQNGNVLDDLMSRDFVQNHFYIDDQALADAGIDWATAQFNDSSDLAAIWEKMHEADLANPAAGGLASDAFRRLQDLDQRGHSVIRELNQTRPLDQKLTYHETLVLSNRNSFLDLDPDNVGVVSVAVPQNSIDSASHHPGEYELRYPPHDVIVMSGHEFPGNGVIRTTPPLPDVETRLFSQIPMEPNQQVLPEHFMPSVKIDQQTLNRMDEHWYGPNFRFKMPADAEYVSPQSYDVRVLQKELDSETITRNYREMQTGGTSTNAEFLPHGFVDNGKLYITDHAEVLVADQIAGHKFPSDVVISPSLADTVKTSGAWQELTDEGNLHYLGVDADGFDFYGKPIPENPGFVSAGGGAGANVPPPPPPRPPVPPAGSPAGPSGPLRWDGRTAAKWWLTHTPDGLSYQKSLLLRAGNPDQWVDTLADIVDDLTNKDPHIAQTILDPHAKVKASQIRGAFTDPETGLVDEMNMPLVHGQNLYQVVGGNPIGKKVQNIVERAMSWMGTMPTDDLSRNRFFAMVFQSEMNAKISRYGTDITEELLNKFEHGARQTALFETKKLLYDLGERSQMATILRHVMPFYPAWQEVLTRWTGLFAENPVALANARLILNAPNKAGVITKDPDTGEEFLTFRIPAFARGLVEHGMLSSAVDDQGYIKIDKNGFNMVSQGMPGFGPFVQLGLKPFVDQHPELEDSLKIIYPFGAPTGISDMFLPSSGRRLQSATAQDGRAYRNAYNRILLTKLVKMQTGEIPKLDLNDPTVASQFVEDTKHEASQFAALKFGLGAISPVAPIFESPYQPMIDAYQKRRQTDPEGADNWFLDEYGEEFFALTQSFTKLADGVSPSIAGYNARQKYQSLVQAYPELGSLIVGDEGGGESVKFSQAVYNKQLQTPVRPGSSTRQRTPLSPEELMQQPSTRLGWIKFTRMMDLIEAAQFERGLPNLQVKDAQDLKNLKQMAIVAIAKQHPSWYEEYSQTDELKWTKKIQGMEKIAADDRLKNRPDIAALSNYLDARKVIVAILQGRDQHGINAADNQGIKLLWESIVAKMKKDSLQFSDLYNRWLDTDPVTPLNEAVVA